MKKCVLCFLNAFWAMSALAGVTVYSPTGGSTMTLNGHTASIGRYDSPTPTSWYGMTINYQMDGNLYQQSYSVYLDKLNFYYKRSSLTDAARILGCAHFLAGRMVL
jgi:hypothetical protein